MKKNILILFIIPILFMISCKINSKATIILKNTHDFYVVVNINFLYNIITTKIDANEEAKVELKWYGRDSTKIQIDATTYVKLGLSQHLVLEVNPDDVINVNIKLTDWTEE